MFENRHVDLKMALCIKIMHQRMDIRYPIDHKSDFQTLIRTGIQTGDQCRWPASLEMKCLYYSIAEILRWEIFEMQDVEEPWNHTVTVTGAHCSHIHAHQLFRDYFVVIDHMGERLGFLPTRGKGCVRGDVVTAFETHWNIVVYCFPRITDKFFSLSTQIWIAKLHGN